MQTLDLEAASSFLFASPSTVLELIAAGELPAAKVGRKWVFVDVDLVEYIRSQYSAKQSKAKSCRSIKEVKSGGFILPVTDAELDNLLTPQKKRRRS